jgi:hypothetical protein
MLILTKRAEEVILCMVYHRASHIFLMRPIYGFTYLVFHFSAGVDFVPVSVPLLVVRLYSTSFLSGKTFDALS